MQRRIAFTELAPHELRQHAETFAPVVGELAFYLVTGWDGSLETSPGMTSGGINRANDNPCP